MMPHLSPSRLPLLLMVAMLAACSDKPGGTAGKDETRQSAAITPIRPVATIRELMDATVDPAADGVWDSVSTIVDEKGTTRHEPRTEAEWHAVRQHAMTLVESMNLLMMEGRHAAPKGTKAGLGELTPQEIDARVAANRDEFNSFAQAVQGEALKAVAAVDRKDPEALTRIGGDLDARCESCHVTFWYPNSPRPAS